ncbi:MAG: hypothetical protein V1821_00835 [bacterium]
MATDNEMNGTPPSGVPQSEPELLPAEALVPVASPTYEELAALVKQQAAVIAALMPLAEMLSDGPNDSNLTAKDFKLFQVEVLGRFAKLDLTFKDAHNRVANPVLERHSKKCDARAEESFLRATGKLEEQEARFLEHFEKLSEIKRELEYLLEEVASAKLSADEAVGKIAELALEAFRTGSDEIAAEAVLKLQTERSQFDSRVQAFRTEIDDRERQFRATFDGLELRLLTHEERVETREESARAAESEARSAEVNAKMEIQTEREALRELSDQIASQLRASIQVIKEDGGKEVSAVTRIAKEVEANLAATVRNVEQQVQLNEEVLADVMKKAVALKESGDLAFQRHAETVAHAHGLRSALTQIEARLEGHIEGLRLAQSPLGSRSPVHALAAAFQAQLFEGMTEISRSDEIPGSAPPAAPVAASAPPIAPPSTVPVAAPAPAPAPVESPAPPVAPIAVPVPTPAVATPSVATTPPPEAAPSFDRTPTQAGPLPRYLAAGGLAPGRPIEDAGSEVTPLPVVPATPAAIPVPDALAPAPVAEPAASSRAESSIPATPSPRRPYTGFGSVMGKPSEGRAPAPDRTSSSASAAGRGSSWRSAGADDDGDSLEEAFVASAPGSRRSVPPRTAVPSRASRPLRVDDNDEEFEDPTLAGWVKRNQRPIGIGAILIGVAVILMTLYPVVFGSSDAESLIASAPVKKPAVNVVTVVPDAGSEQAWDAGVQVVAVALPDAGVPQADKPVAEKPEGKVPEEKKEEKVTAAEPDKPVPKAEPAPARKKSKPVERRVAKTDIRRGSTPMLPGDTGDFAPYPGSQPSSAPIEDPSVAASQPTKAPEKKEVKVAATAPKPRPAAKPSPKPVRATPGVRTCPRNQVEFVGSNGLVLCNGVVLVR